MKSQYELKDTVEDISRMLSELTDTKNRENNIRGHRSFNIQINGVSEK